MAENSPELSDLLPTSPLLHSERIFASSPPAPEPDPAPRLRSQENNHARNEDLSTLLKFLAELRKKHWSFGKLLEVLTEHRKNYRVRLAFNSFKTFAYKTIHERDDKPIRHKDWQKILVNKDDIFGGKSHWTTRLTSGLSIPKP